MDQFLKIFGSITVLQAVEFISAVLFLYFVYKKVNKFLIQQHETQRTKDEQLKEALEGVRKYPEYRQQSIEIQKQLVNQIQELRDAQKEIKAHLDEVEESNKHRERNKLRDMLLQSYRYYTNPETNPTRSWNKMEAEAFWELFDDYIEAGGNGYMKNNVKPAMMRLLVTEIGEYR